MSTYPATVRARASSRIGHKVVIWVALAVALIGAVLVLALSADDNSGSRTVIDGAQSRPIGPHYPSIAAESQPIAPNSRFDGGPQEGTRGVVSRAQADSAVTRFDGGPQEGTRGISLPANPVQAPTFDRGPRAGHVGDPVSRVQTPSPAVSPTRFDGGPEEGTRGVVVEYTGTNRFDGGPDEGTRGR